MNKPRVLCTVAIDGRNTWRERTSVRRVQAIGKKTTISMPEDVINEVLAAGQKLRVAVTFDEVYDTPSYETLFTLRHALVAIAPPDLRSLFREAGSVKTWEERTLYETCLVDAALDRAQVIETVWDGDRAPCPFCGETPQPPGPPQGFAYPNGLIMHLEGSGNARLCDVMDALMSWARNSIQGS